MSVKKRLPVGLASCTAVPASSPVHVYGVVICEFTLNNNSLQYVNNIHCGMVMFIITVVSHGM